MENKYLLEDALWKMAYFSESDPDEANIGTVELDNSPMQNSVAETAEKSQVEVQEPELAEDEVTVAIELTGRKPPSYQDVSISMPSELFQQRTEEMKTYGIHYLDKWDADFSDGIDLGVDRIKVIWKNELPELPSAFGENWHPYSEPRSDLELRFGRKPPSNNDILQWCRSRKLGVTTPSVVVGHREDEEHEDTLNAGNKTCLRIRRDSEDSIGSEMSMSPPSSLDGNEIDALDGTMETKHRYSLEISGRTLTSSSEMRSDKETSLRGVNEVDEYNHLISFCVEIFVNTRQSLLPDPEFDAVTCITYSICFDGPRPNTMGLFALDVMHDDRVTEATSTKSNFLDKSGHQFQGGCIQIFQTETELIKKLIDKVKTEDPDILVGYDTQRSSWGFLCRRASAFGIDLPTELSRIPLSTFESKFAGPQGASDIDAELKIGGRIILNVWRLLRLEVTLTEYSYENVVWHVLKRRCAKFSSQTLTKMWSMNHTRWMVIDYLTKRSGGTMELLDKLDVLGRTSELAKLFGIQFLEVLTRGSQFRVESIMLRLARAQNLIPVSPSIQQRAQMRAPEYLPLVMEPESRLYNDPVIVLDFQSLYPSIIMAYNYCYSTCLGRIIDHMSNGPLGQPFTLGCTHFKISPQRLENLRGNVNFSPGGIGFVKPSLRKGILPQMLEEILDTRVMVKSSAKLNNKLAQEDKALAKKNAKLQRILHARQLGLKLIANVTYGYTSANFSGRMPCIDVGDSVVSKGRETLERAIKTIEGGRWPGVKVIYGDTDSLFVLLPGRNREESFDIGDQMAKVVTQENPKPVKLKFEKVYHPCILQTKKRYVGYMYESRDQEKPTYDAKGIETVRRDGVPATVKMLEKSLRILFETKNISMVKQFVQNQIYKIALGRISLQELIFAREFRGLHGYRPGACVPALELTRRFCKHDRMRVPNIGERVPYVIVYGEPGKPLIQSVRSPEEVLWEKWNTNQGEPVLRPNAIYYITKVIVPPLSRCLSLIGVDVISWYADLSRIRLFPRLPYMIKGQEEVETGQGMVVMPKFFSTRVCFICHEKPQSLPFQPICSSCMKEPDLIVHTLTDCIRRWDSQLLHLDSLCRGCDVAFDSCRNLSCPRMYLRTEAKSEADQIQTAFKILSDF